jgi:hypothetical protein
MKIPILLIDERMCYSNSNLVNRKYNLMIENFKKIDRRLFIVINFNINFDFNSILKCFCEFRLNWEILNKLIKLEYAESSC